MQKIFFWKITFLTKFYGILLWKNMCYKENAFSDFILWQYHLYVFFYEKFIQPSSSILSFLTHNKKASRSITVKNQTSPKYKY